MTLSRALNSLRLCEGMIWERRVSAITGSAIMTAASLPFVMVTIPASAMASIFSHGQRAARMP